MVRHGYINCTSCHVSPSGGGVLTPYGRSLSKEVLSTAGTDSETAFIYKVNPPEWLNLGGDVRTLQTYQNSPQAISANLILMQADLEAAATYGKFTIDGTLGYSDQGNPQLWTDYVLSRRHYLMYKPLDELSIRFGKFLYAYGINTPDHSITIKRGIQIDDEGTETYNLETAWLGETFNVYLTGIFGRPDNLSLNREKGVTLNVSAAPSSTYKIGASYLYGVSQTGNRSVAGPYGILGFTPHFFLLSEFDFEGNLLNGDPRGRVWGLAEYQRLDYEYFQGFHGYLVQQLLRSDFKDPNTLTKSYGLGIQFFPRPHFDLVFEWQILIPATTTSYTDFAFFMFHFYL
jgi:hypothetical protein